MTAPVAVGTWRLPADRLSPSHHPHLAPAPHRLTTPTAAREQTSLYLGRAGQQEGELHLSAIPFISGLDALCGQPLSAPSSSPIPWRQTISLTTCSACYGRANQFMGIVGATGV